VLALSRRAELGLGDRIKTVRRAVVMLGLETVRSAVLSVCVFDLLRSQVEHDGGLDLVGYWKHAMGVACAAQAIAKEHRSLRIVSDEAFLAGLLHDLGRPALAVALPRAMVRAQELAAGRGVEACAVEREVLGIDHARAGKRLAERWSLPESLRRVIWLHVQEPGAIPDDEYRRLTLLVRVARGLCRELHLGISGDHGIGPDWRAECAALGIDVARVESIGRRLHAEVGERCRDLGVCDEHLATLMLESIQRANERLGRQVAAMERRQRRERCASEALGVIGDFLAHAGMSDDPRELLAGVVLSSARWFDSDAWVVVQGSPEGAHALAFCGEIDVELEAQGIAAGVLEALGGGDGLGDLDLRTSDEIGAKLGRQGRLMRALRLVGGERWVVLIGDALPRELGPIDRTLVAVWSQALVRSDRSERDRALSERLADASVRIASMQASRSREESMRRLGEMTAGAAHEMNNPLTTISGQAQRLANRLEGADRDAAGLIVDAAHDLSELVSGLHLLAREPEVCAGDVDVRDVIERAVELGCERAGLDVPVEIVCAGIQWHSDRELLVSALGELIANALIFGDGDGVWIRAETMPPDGRLRIAVQDRGRGLSDRARRHAFDPFFSERDAGRGRGLGLSRARRLVMALEGDIGLLGRPEGGVEAWIELRRTGIRKESA